MTFAASSTAAVFVMLQWVTWSLMKSGTVMLSVCRRGVNSFLDLPPRPQ